MTIDMTFESCNQPGRRYLHVRTDAGGENLNLELSDGLGCTLNDSELAELRKAIDEHLNRPKPPQKITLEVILDGGHEMNQWQLKNHVRKYVGTETGHYPLVYVKKGPADG